MKTKTFCLMVAVLVVLPLTAHVHAGEDLLSQMPPQFPDVRKTGGMLSIWTHHASPSGEVIDGLRTVVIASFCFYAEGEDIEIQGLPVGCFGAKRGKKLIRVRAFLDNALVATAHAVACGERPTILKFDKGKFIAKKNQIRVLHIVVGLDGPGWSPGDGFTLQLNHGSSNAFGLESGAKFSTASVEGNPLVLK